MRRPFGHTLQPWLLIALLAAMIGGVACDDEASSSRSLDDVSSEDRDVLSDVASDGFDAAEPADVTANQDTVDRADADPPHPDVSEPAPGAGLPIIAPLVLQPLQAGSVWSGHLQAWSPRGQTLELAMIGGDDRVRFDKRTGHFLVDVSRLREGPLAPWFRARDQDGLESYLRWSISPDQHFGTAMEAEQNVTRRWPAGVLMAVAPQVSGRATGPLRFRARGTVPPGLELDERHGWVVWRPGRTLVGTSHDLQWRVTDAEGQSADVRWTLEVVDASPLTLPTLQVDPSREGPLDLMEGELPDALQAGPYRCESLRWQGANPGFRFDESTCTLTPGELPATIWQGGTLTWMVVAENGTRWVAERSLLLTPATSCTLGNSDLDDWFLGLVVEAGIREDTTLQFCDASAGTLLQLPFDMPAGASWFEVGLSHDAASTVDLDLHLRCDDGVLESSAGSGAQDWLSVRLGDRTGCMLEVRSVWPIVEPVRARLSLAWKRDPACAVTPDNGGVVTGGQVVTGVVCPGEALTLPLHQAPPLLELQARDGVLDLEVLARTTQGESVLATALGRQDGGLVTLDLSTLAEPGENEERFIRLRPRQSSMRGVDYVLSDPQRGLRQP